VNRFLGVLAFMEVGIMSFSDYWWLYEAMHPVSLRVVSMLKVLSCIATDHSYGLLALATLVCVLGSILTVRLYARVQRSVGMQRLNWLFTSGVVGGSTVWMTHFIAMLSFNPPLPHAYEPTMTMASLAAAIGVYYQYQNNSVTRDVIGFEVLLRFRGSAALAPSGPGHGAAGGVHSDCRQEWLHSRIGGLGPAHGLSAGGVLGEPAQDCGQCRAGPARQCQPRGTGA
jgi:hypothetical protein